MSETRQLFGGAITAQFPTGFIDASDFRHVPNNQEVLVRDDSDVSCIIEVLQLATDEGAASGLEQAARFHFGSLAHDNSASSHQVQSIHQVGRPSGENQTPAPTLLVGAQTIKKFGKKSEPTDLVRIRLALWRLESKNIDLIMSFNQPLGSETSGMDQLDEAVAGWFDKAASSLEIKDWSVFV